MSHRKVALVTGASSGIGKECVALLCEKGYRVYGTSRQAPPLSRLHAVPDPANPLLTMMYMDVDQDASVQTGIENIIEIQDRLDVVVNCAGFVLAGAIEETTIAEAKAQFETNFFGTLRVCRAVLPTMRAQRSGCIVNIGSIAGLIALPFQGMYSAAKSAIEGLTEALSLEVKDFGIRVVVVEPGDCRTRVDHYRVRTAQSHSSAVYKKNLEAALSVMEKDERNGSDPSRVARQIVRIVESTAPRLRYTVGSNFERAAAILKKLLPARIVEQLVQKYYQIG
jgi:NAD(P)-dependent dehydrogenase (short-subunit alcohol dehydrogenase family)